MVIDPAVKISVVIRLARQKTYGREPKIIGVHKDEATSVVFGMPRVAIELNAIDLVLPLEAIAGRIHSLATG